MSERGTVQDGKSGPEIQVFLRAQVRGATVGDAIKQPINLDEFLRHRYRSDVAVGLTPGP
jgi:hypothetical protein